MISAQPEALRLADSMARCEPVDFDGDFRKAAAELRRLHALNAELVGVLRGLEAMADRYRQPGAPIPDAQKSARAALAKAEAAQ